MAPDELTTYAREIAPHVDRLAIAVHKHGRPAGAALLREFGLSGAGILVTARPMLLAGPITADDLALIMRYAPRESLAAAVEESVRQGLLARDDAAETPLYACTTRGRDLLLRLTELHGQTIAALWARHDPPLPGLAAAATRVTDHAAATLPLDLYPAFRLQHAAPAPLGASPAHLLLTRLTTLRYLRADAHASAWAVQGLDAAQTGVLSALWRAQTAQSRAEVLAGWDVAAGARALEALHARKLAEQEGELWRISAAGRALRDRIEGETDRGAAPPFVALDPSERAAFLHGLEQLPD